MCLHCDLAQPEDQQHILCVCPLYQFLRDKLNMSAATEWNRVMAIDWEQTTPDERTSWLLSCPTMYREVGDYLHDAFRLKARVETPMDHDESDAVASDLHD